MAQTLRSSLRSSDTGRPSPSTGRPSIVDRMVARGHLNRDELARVLSAGGMTEPPHRVAIIAGLVAEDDFLALAAEELQAEILEELPAGYDASPFSSISLPFMEEHRFLPLSQEGRTLTVLVADPYDHKIPTTLTKLPGVSRIAYALAREERIKAWIKAHFAKEEATEERDEEEVDVLAGIDVEDVEQLKDLASEAPVIRKVNQILTKAVEAGASDVHIEAFQERVQVRFRIDGLLHEIEALPKHLLQSIVTRVKILSRLDIAERRLPQDGRIFLQVAGKKIDMRVSCLPTAHGESVVMRILDREAISFDLARLGFPGATRETFETLIRQPYGILLVTGPTGSGKTTTLYSALNAINTPEKKIVTIEDPVEYNLDGINQVHVNTKSGLTFARGLRSIVRQDPDVILIGEIRDQETADIAIQSALTGHLVFSTLHTNDAASAVTRLLEIGVEDYLLASSMIGVMAQRLVRVLCQDCKVPEVPDKKLVEKLRLPFLPSEERPVYGPGGCPNCGNTGFKGRVAIFELMAVTDEVKTLILENRSATVIRDMAVSQGMTLLKQDGWRKVAEGLTSITEVLRVAGQ